MKILFFFISTFICTQSLLAQTSLLNYGLKAGISVGKIAVLPPMQHRTENYGLGVTAGGFIQIPIFKKLNVQIEPSYNLNRSSFSFSNPNLFSPKKHDLSLHQISIPLQFGYFLFPKWSINAGLSANYNFYFQNKITFDNGASPSTYATFNVTEEITKFQPGALAGFTFYATKHLSIDGGYHRMLTNSYHRPTGDEWTEYLHGFFQARVGYRLK